MLFFRAAGQAMSHWPDFVGQIAAVFEALKWGHRSALVHVARRRAWQDTMMQDKRSPERIWPDGLIVPGTEGSYELQINDQMVNQKITDSNHLNISW